MNNRAEAFKKFLEEKNINSFQVNEFENNEFNTVVFRSNLDIKGQKLPVLVILDDSIYGMIRVFVAAKALNKDNETELRIGINELNKTYKSFKYYFDNEDNLILDCCILLNEIEKEVVAENFATIKQNQNQTLQSLNQNNNTQKTIKTKQETIPQSPQNPKELLEFTKAQNTPKARKQILSKELKNENWQHTKHK